MSYVAKLLGGVLERFDLLPELGLFGLLFAQYLMDIFHERPPFGTLWPAVATVNEAPGLSDYARNLAKARTLAGVDGATDSVDPCDLPKSSSARRWVSLVCALLIAGLLPPDPGRRGGV